ncbi:YjcZ family sporulation protein [Bacillus salipaludis]|uniref:YjcZ family sporulation protein n=1 Tax=Bacillus salipaludis TaxID=2547811 RepID=A0A4V3ATE0_9BACI|nr:MULTISPECIES: YjcZ family sporulation protein [Bacillus]MDQ6598198.1 YjcZ family sporulation protein [Bacillus salipaludis]TDK59421.1 YjcZ family sporulation protein [Bacillus salipaludis]
MSDGVGFAGGGFALLVVLFILLIIIGASFVGGFV